MPSKGFHERFSIDVNRDEAHRRFINRAYGTIFRPIMVRPNTDPYKTRIQSAIVYALGEYYVSTRSLSDYIGMDFHKMLIALEAYYQKVHDSTKPSASSSIVQLLSDSETGLDIAWQDGKFIPVGAVLLDDALVNDNLRWLRESGHTSVLEPFEKGLRHLLESEKRPELLLDVVTDMYESLEAIAGTVTGRTGKDLSANAELFLSALDVSQEYRALLKEYIGYANRFRHAAEAEAGKPEITRGEAESFTYLTGLLLRLAVRPQ